LFNAPSRRQVDLVRHVEELDILAFLNHSCNPTCIIKGADMAVYAARDIAVSEELTFFYPSTEWHMAQPFVCGCGSKNCVRVVSGAKHLPLDTLSKFYINAHILQLMFDQPIQLVSAPSPLSAGAAPALDTLVVPTPSAYSKSVDSLLTVRHGAAAGQRLCRIAVPAGMLADKPNRGTIQVGDHAHALSGGIGPLAHLTHSCAPNCHVAVRRATPDEEGVAAVIDLVALRHIGEGEPLTYFYPSTEFQQSDCFLCGCRAPGCIGVVAGGKFVCMEQLARVAINPHIREAAIRLLGGAALLA